MKKTLVVLALFIFSLSFAQQKQNFKSNPFMKFTTKLKRRSTLEIYTEKVEKLKFAHPQTFTRKQVNKIFHAIKVKGNPDVLVLNNDEILKITKKFIQTFQSAKTNEMVVLKKKTTFSDANNPETKLTREETLKFYFMDPDTLRVSYLYSGFEKARVLKEGFLVTHAKIKGKEYKSIIDIKKDLWTKYINKEIFPGEYEKTFNQLRLQNQQAPSVEELKDKKTEETQKVEKTISVEEMEKELSRLRDMLNKKLITQEEYEVLRKNILKKAGL